MPDEKKDSDKIRVCIDFRNLSKATLKDKYSMPTANMLINEASGPSRLVKEIVSEIDTVFENNFDHYRFAIKIYKIWSIYTFTKLYFKINLLTSLLYFKRNKFFYL